MSRVREGRRGGFVVSAMQDVVELRDRIATFDAYWHNASEKTEKTEKTVSVTGGGGGGIQFILWWSDPYG